MRVCVCVTLPLLPFLSVAVVQSRDNEALRELGVEGVVHMGDAGPNKCVCVCTTWHCISICNCVGRAQVDLRSHPTSLTAEVSTHTES